jgi:hypothetical protein
VGQPRVVGADRGVVHRPRLCKSGV